MRVDFQTCNPNNLSKVKNNHPRSNYFSKVPFDTISFGNSDDFLHLPKHEIVERISESLNTDHILGVGGEGKVYTIKDTNLCIKIPHEASEEFRNGTFTQMSNLEQVNHGVAKLGKKTLLMKRIEGFSMFPHKTTGVNRAQVHLMIDKLPVAAYRNVIAQIYDAYNKGAYFDSSGANVIVNPVKKTMTVIDFTDCLECSNSRILKSLFITLGMNDGLLIKAQQKDRANKILSSVIDDFLPGQKPLMRVADYSFSEFIYAMKNQGLINKAYSDVFIKILNELKELKYMTMRGARDCAPEMEFRVKQIKSLIKQLLT